MLCVRRIGRQALVRICPVNLAAFSNLFQFGEAKHSRVEEDDSFRGGELYSSDGADH